MKERNITFLPPEFGGTHFSINNDEYFIIAPSKEKLTDSFLDTLIAHHRDNDPCFSVHLCSSPEKDQSIIIRFSDSELTIEQDCGTKTYPYTFNDFYEVFTESVEKYSMYYAAPANYRSFFYSSFDQMISKMERYRDAANAICKKIQ